MSVSRSGVSSGRIGSGSVGRRQLELPNGEVLKVRLRAVAGERDTHGLVGAAVKFDDDPELAAALRDVRAHLHRPAVRA